MIKSARTAEFQLLQLIKNLDKRSKSLNNDQLIEVLSATKSICDNKQLITTLVKSLKALNGKKINNQNAITQREKQVLLLIGEGLKSVDIATNLNLSKSTIETHRKNIRKKLQLSGNENLFAFALLFHLQYKNGVEVDDFE